MMAAAYCTHSYKSAIFSGFASFSSSSNRYDSKWFSSFTVSISELSSHYNNAHNMKNGQLAERKLDKNMLTRIFSLTNWPNQLTKAIIIFRRQSAGPQFSEHLRCVLQRLHLFALVEKSVIECTVSEGWIKRTTFIKTREKRRTNLFISNASVLTARNASSRNFSCSMLIWLSTFIPERIVMNNIMNYEQSS